MVPPPTHLAPLITYTKGTLEPHFQMPPDILVPQNPASA